MCRPKDPFAKISTFAKLKKLQTNKNGRELVVTDFTLAGNQFEEIDDLTSNETEVMVTVQPSRRGTIYQGQDVDYRVKSEDYQFEQDAIAELVLRASDDMRERMIDKFADGVRGWDDEDALETVKANIEKCVKNEDWVDAMNNIMILRNLQKPVQEVTESEDEEQSPSFFDGEESDSEAGKQELADSQV